MIYHLVGILLVGCFTLSAGMPPCECTRDKNLVCGSDGKTYSNKCMLNCAKASNPLITLRSTGRCKREAPLCFCTFENNPFCGTDGQTYSNMCELQCKQAADPNLRVRHQGECRVKRQLDILSERCSCPRSTKYVCGNDGNTYANPCLLNCASEADPRLYVASFGPCSNEVKVVEQAEETPSCTCTRDYKPVCASNGVTFGNECLLRCAGTNLSVQNHGPCQA